MFASILTSINYEFVILENADDGIQTFRQSIKSGFIYDFIFMKLIMPGTNGYDAVKEMRKIENEYRFNDADRHLICGLSAEISESK